MAKFNVVKMIKGFGRFLFSLTLIPYAVKTYKELKTVSWMSYPQTIRVTLFVISFAVVTAVSVYGVDQIVSKVFDIIIKKA